MHRAVTLLALLVALTVATACGQSSTSSRPGVSPSPLAPSPADVSGVGGPCPTAPIAVIAVENFYGNMLEQLGGQCVKVTSLLADPSADPHEYQPNAKDAMSYQVSKLVVENGLGYDDFSDKIVATLGQKPTVLNMGEMLGLKVGDNPHVWYGPEYVDKIAKAMTQSLKQISPSASSYFDSQADAFLGNGLASYRSSVQQLGNQFKDAPIGSTESIFSYMARSTGLNLISPPALMDSVSEGNDPAARDVALFQDQITKHQIRILVYNVQTDTHLTEQLKAMAAANSILVVGVSETMPPGARSFQDWQTDQLQQLIKALAASGG